MSLALTPWQTFSRVVLPPALARIWPALVSQIIIVMLGSAVCGQISAEEGRRLHRLACRSAIAHTAP
jgi:polar amino acid transport system permease protein